MHPASSFGAGPVISLRVWRTKYNDIRRKIIAIGMDTLSIGPSSSHSPTPTAIEAPTNADRINMEVILVGQNQLNSPKLAKKIHETAS
mmetsp:Transcript_13718/g.20900  ORF Transcript_13718/g.20900 Transcript_13718/m.20900 type:complete len:88 (+) Transcript_13718:938-1201(+)